MKWKFKIIKVALFVMAGIGILGWLVMALWNWLIPSLFSGAHPIDYVHALGLFVLSKILFGGFRGHGGWHRHGFRQRWEQMAPEEREKFQRGMFFGRGGPKQ